jgi:hypothetical protein
LEESGEQIMQILPSLSVRLHAGTGSDVLAVGLPGGQAIRAA